MLTSSQIDNIVDDLLRKRPKGPEGVSLSYTLSREWNDRAYEYKNIPVPSIKNYGYEKETIFMLGFNDLSNVRRYVRERWFSGMTSYEIARKKSTITRRSNRLWDRIQSAVKQISREGSRGIYKLTEDRYSSPAFTGYIFAGGANEAHALIRTFFPSLGESYVLRFLEIGDVEKLKSYNDTMRQDIESKIKRIEVDIAKGQKKISELKNYASTLQTLSGHQLAVESV